MDAVRPSYQDLTTTASRMEVARQAFNEGNPAKAIAILQQTHAQSGATADSEQLLSEICFFTGNHGDALSAINNALVLSIRDADSPPPDIIVRKAVILSRMGRKENAVETLRSVPSAGRRSAYFRALREAIESKDGLTTFENIAGADFFGSSPSSLTALNHYAILLREMGNHRASIATARARFLKAEKCFRFGQSAKPAVKPSWVAEAAVCLSDLKLEFDKAGVSFFLISGTFLGAVREGDIIGHDKDIDVGVDESVSPESLRELFHASTHFVVKEIPSKRSVYLEHANGVKVDVFVHYLEDGRYWHEGPKVRWWNSPFDLVEIPFLGSAYKVPADADRYLTENYGEWKTPVADFETFVDTPNMEVTNQNHMVWYFMTKLVDYHLLGRKPQFSRVWAALQAIHPIDDQLTAAAHRVLEKRSVERSKVQVSGVRTRRMSLRAAMADGPVKFGQRLGRYAARFVRSAGRLQ